MELSLHRLKLLSELERRGTVTAAAGALSYTVSAVSQQLAQLERDAGTTLFEKNGRRIVLTEAGVVLVRHARHILAAVEDAGNAMEAARHGVAATVTAGVWASVAAGLLPTALRLLAERHPGVDVYTRELAPEETAGAVRDGTLDLAFVIDYSSYPIPLAPRLDQRVICMESMHVAVPPGTVEGDTVALAELADQPWILSGPRSQFGRAVRMACREAGFDPAVRHEVGEQSTALSMVAAGLGVTMVSDLGLQLLPEGLDIVSVEEDFSRTVSVVSRSRDADRASLDAVVTASLDAAAELGLTTP